MDLRKDSLIVSEGFKSKYIDAFDSFCFQNCVLNILENYKIENAIDYLNLGLSLTVDFKKKCHFQYVTWQNSLLPRFSGLLELHFEKNGDIDDVICKNINLVNKGYPLILSCDTFYLPYTPFFHRSHGNHTLIMYDVNREKNQFKISDCFHTWKYNGYIDIGIIKEARKSNNEFDGGMFSGEPIELGWAKLERHGWQEERKSLILQNLNIYLSNYSAGRKGKRRYGKEALNEIFIYLKNCSIDKYVLLYRESYYFIKRRKLFFYYIGTFASIYTLYVEQNKVLFENMNKWEIWHKNLLKVGLKSDERKRIEICTMFWDLIIEEYKVYSTIESMVRALK